MTVPVEMPGLIHGDGETPARGACVMQAVAWLATGGDEWTDAPACTHRVLRRVAINVNDNVTDTARRQMWPLVPRLMGTATGDRKTDIRIGIALAAWSAERVLPLIKDETRHAKAARQIGRARAWLDQGKPPAAAAAADAYAAYAAAAAADAYAAYAADAAYATAYAADAAAADAADAAAADAAAADAAAADAAAADAAAAYAAAAAADADAAAADAAAADAAYAAAYAAAAADADAAAYAADADAAAAAYAAYAAAAADSSRIQFLTDLLDEYDRITGRTAPAQITTAQWTALHDALTGQAADA